MKDILQQQIPYYLLLAFLFPSYAFGQAITTPTTATGEAVPVVKFEQGNIIGSLPYGRHFYIQGSLAQPGNAVADQVAVEIYDTGKIGIFKKNKVVPTLSEDDISRIVARKENLMATSSWNAYEAATTANPKPTQFSVYINTPLKFSHRYLVKFSYSKIFNYTLTEVEKDTILSQLERETYQIFNNTGEVVVETIQQKLNDLVIAALKLKVEAAGDSYFDLDKIRQNFKPVTATSIQQLGNIIPELAGYQLNIQDLQGDIERLEKRKASLTAADSSDLVSLNSVIASKKSDLATEKKTKTAKETQLSNYLQLIKNQLITIGQSYAVGGSNETSVTELQSIQIGSSFGSGFVGLNFNDAASRDFDAFSYTALKFYFLPVDKRIADPYLDDVFLLNRLSFIFGIATNGQFNYKGVSLQKALAVTPVVGFGYDFSRYFSIDIGATIFQQTAVSPFSNAEITRVGPVIGLNFDVDIFNRFSSLFTGDKYSIK